MLDVYARTLVIDPVCLAYDAVPRPSAAGRSGGAELESVAWVDRDDYLVGVVFDALPVGGAAEVTSTLRGNWVTHASAPNVEWAPGGRGASFTEHRREGSPVSVSHRLDKWPLRPALVRTITTGVAWRYRDDLAQPHVRQRILELGSRLGGPDTRRFLRGRDGDGDWWDDPQSLLRLAELLGGDSWAADETDEPDGALSAASEALELAALEIRGEL